MNRYENQSLWLFFNIFFIIAYSSRILPIFITIPFRVPNFILSLTLIITYYLTLNTTPFKCMHNKSNFYCILIFTTFPHFLILFPFYILSYFNTCNFVVLKKSYYERHQFLYNIAASSMPYKRTANLIAAIIEILLVPTCFLLVILGFVSVLTMGTLAMAVYREYLKSSVMKEAFSLVRIHCDRMSDKLGIYKIYYEGLKEFIIKNLAVAESGKNNE